MTKDMLITPNKYSRPQTKIGKIKRIVVHWIGNAGTTAENNAKYFDGLKVGKKNSAGNYIYASSHYIIGNDGVLVRCVPEDEVAYHASDANSYSIGVEVCHPDWNGQFTEKAYKRLVELLVQLCKKYQLEPTQAIIRHYDVTGKCCPKYYVDNKEAFKKLKEEVARGVKCDQELINAVGVLQTKGIISSPDVWGDVEKINLNNVEALICKFGMYFYKEGNYVLIIQKLTTQQIINTPKIWIEHTYNNKNVRDLLIKISVL